MADEGAAEWARFPFDEAIAFFRDKLNVITESYADMVGKEHAKAFTTAGAMYADLLTEMRDAVDIALADGESVQEFRERFAEIAEKYGWDYFGSEEWRSLLIYKTNLASAYAAGRWDQMQKLKDRRPYIEYRHSGKPKGQRRELHAQWDGLVLKADDPFWLTHYPPNGYGCGCMAYSLSERDMKREGLKVQESPKIEYYEWTNPRTGEVLQVPEGIDPGFDFNVGIEQHKPDLDEYPKELADMMKAMGIKEWESK